MRTENFQKLIRAVTGRDFTIELRDNWRTTKPAGELLAHETVYFVGRTLPITGRIFGFEWKTPKADEKMLRSFITAFTSKYREPDPRAYVAGPYGGRNWADMSPEKREHAFGHHSSNMLSREMLLRDVEARFACPEMESALNQWGFYETEYGIGIFCFWETQYVRNAIDKMRTYLSALNVSAREEYSDARWVYRFRIEASREMHVSILSRFCQS
jgi:hypothetical protein